MTEYVTRLRERKKFLFYDCLVLNNWRQKVGKNRDFLSAREKLRTVLVVGVCGRSMVGSSLRKNMTGTIEGF